MNLQLRLKTKEKQKFKAKDEGVTSREEMSQNHATGAIVPSSTCFSRFRYFHHTGFPGAVPRMRRAQTLWRIGLVGCKGRSLSHILSIVSQYRLVGTSGTHRVRRWASRYLFTCRDLPSGYWVGIHQEQRIRAHASFWECGELQVMD